MTGDGLRIGFAFAAGAATFFAPCAYPLLPGYVAFFLGQEADESAGGVGTRLGRAAVVGTTTSLGFFLVYAVLAGVALTIGTRALRGIAILEVVVGGLLIVLGIGTFLGRFQLSHTHAGLPARRRSPGGFLAFGIVYAVAAAGCTAPVFVGIVGVTLTGSPSNAILTLSAYAGGMAVLMLAVTGLAALGWPILPDRLTSVPGRIQRAAGALLAVAGLAQIYLYTVGFDWLGILRLV